MIVYLLRKVTNVVLCYGLLQMKVLLLVLFYLSVFFFPCLFASCCFFRQPRVVATLKAVATLATRQSDLELEQIHNIPTMQ